MVILGQNRICAPVSIRFRKPMRVNNLRESNKRLIDLGPNNYTEMAKSDTHDAFERLDRLEPTTCAHQTIV